MPDRTTKLQREYQDWYDQLMDEVQFGSRTPRLPIPYTAPTGPQFDPRSIPDWNVRERGMHAVPDPFLAQQGTDNVPVGFPRRVPPVPRMSTWGDYFTRLAQPDEGPEDQAAALRMFQQFMQFQRERERQAREEATISAETSPERLQKGTGDVEHFQSGTSDAQRKQAIINKITSGHQDYTYGPGSPGATRSDMRQKVGTGDHRLTHGDVAVPPEDYALFTPAERRQYRIFDKSMIHEGVPTPLGSVERYYAQRGVPLPKIGGGSAPSAIPRAQTPPGVTPPPTVPGSPMPGWFRPGIAGGAGPHRIPTGAGTPGSPTLSRIGQPTYQYEHGEFEPRSYRNIGPGPTGPLGVGGGYPPMNFSGPYSMPPYNPSGSLWTQGQTGATGPGYGKTGNASGIAPPTMFPTPGVSPTPRPSATTPLVVPPGGIPGHPVGQPVSIWEEPGTRYEISERIANPEPREAGASMFDQYGGPSSNYFNYTPGSAYGGGGGGTAGSAFGYGDPSATGGYGPGGLYGPGAYTGPAGPDVESGPGGGGVGGAGAAAGAAGAAAGGGAPPRPAGYTPTGQATRGNEYYSGDFGRGMFAEGPGPSSGTNIGRVGTSTYGTSGTVGSAGTVGNMATAIGFGGNLGGGGPTNASALYGGARQAFNTLRTSIGGNYVRFGYGSVMPMSQFHQQFPGQEPGDIHGTLPRGGTSGTTSPRRERQKGDADVHPARIIFHRKLLKKPQL